MASTLPAASIARTSKVWAPLPARCRPSGAAGSPGRPVEPALERRAGLRGSKRKLAEVAVVVPEGPAEIDVSGADASIVQARRPGSRRHCRPRRSRDLEAVGATAARCRPSASCRPPGRPVEPALERRAGLRGGKRNARRSRRRRARGTRRDRRVRRRRIHTPGPRGRGRVDVAGGVDRAHLEVVGAICQPGVGLRRAAGPPGRAVEPALERRAGLRGSERNARRSRRRRARGTRRDRRVRRRRIDRPGARGRGGVDVAGGVDRAHLEAVGATCKPGVGLRRAAGPPGRAVEPALERRAGLRGGKRNARRSRSRRARRTRRDRRVRRGGVTG